MEIRYFDGKTVVNLGDHVEKRGLFGRRHGRVSYVPGISEVNPNMEFNGLIYVGIKFDGGGLVATLVDPKIFLLKKTIRFCKRGNRICDEIQPDQSFNG
jgi:hypothetical protein